MKSLTILTLASFTAAQWISVSPSACADNGGSFTNIMILDTSDCFGLPLAAESWIQDGPGTTYVLYTESGCAGNEAGLEGCNPNSPAGCCFDAVRIPGAVGPWVAARCVSTTQ
ncbi:hypothetical protein F5B19DRAFT_444071 [Rostrohypoxylon terebratum]|nr:hypothetical protein F5B19DRAFT_444071 [Rostrohypoxylon terebratum]